MRITLTQIWAANAEQLQPVLQTQGRISSGAIGRDRALLP